MQDDFADGGLYDVKTFGNGHLCQSTSMESADFYGLTGGEFCGPGSLAGRANDTLASLAPHIGKVVCAGAGEEVVGSDAWRVITVVTDHETRWDGAIAQFPGDSVSDKPSLIPHEAAIAGVVSIPDPEPTSFGLMYLSPETADMFFLGKWRPATSAIWPTDAVCHGSYCSTYSHYDYT